MVEMLADKFVIPYFAAMGAIELTLEQIASFDSFRPTTDDDLLDVSLSSDLEKMVVYMKDVEAREKSLIVHESTTCIDDAATVLGSIEFWLQQQSKATCICIFESIRCNRFPECFIAAETKCPKTKKDTIPLVVEALKVLMLEDENNCEDDYVIRLIQVCETNKIELKKVAYDLDSRLNKTAVKKLP